MFKDVYKSANKKISIKTGLVENTENKIREQLKYASDKHGIHFGYRKAVIPICAVVVLLVIAVIPHALNSIFSKNALLIRNGPGIFKNSNGGNIVAGVSMSPFYRYNGSYYSLKDAPGNIQKNISRHLSGDFYEIKGVNTSKSIAIFINNYYYRLDYAFKDTVIFNGKTYVMNATEGDKPGKYLGTAGKYKIYALPGADASEEILVKIGEFYCFAYQYLSLVDLNGITYELELNKCKIDKNTTEEYIGMAGPYKAYKCGYYDINKMIMLHINDTEAVQANAISADTGGTIPKSKYGSPEESMYPVLQTIQWKGHGIYMDNSKDESDLLKKQIGKKLGDYSCQGYNYEIYEMKGEASSKGVIVKNNQAYLKYSFMFTDTINFNGKTYVIGDSNANYIKGCQIGIAGSNKVYEIKGLDADKVIDVVMSGSAEGISLKSDFTAYRK